MQAHAKRPPDDLRGIGARLVHRGDDGQAGKGIRPGAEPDAVAHAQLERLGERAFDRDFGGLRSRG